MRRTLCHLHRLRPELSDLLERSHPSRQFLYQQEQLRHKHRSRSGEPDFRSVLRLRTGRASECHLALPQRDGSQSLKVFLLQQVPGQLADEEHQAGIIGREHGRQPGRPHLKQRRCQYRSLHRKVHRRRRPLALHRHQHRHRIVSQPRTRAGSLHPAGNTV